MRGPTESAVDKREGTVSSDGTEVGSALSLAVRGSVGFSDSIEVSVALVIEEDSTSGVGKSEATSRDDG